MLSVLAHFALVSVLFSVAGVAAGFGRTRCATVVRAATEAPSRTRSEFPATAAEFPALPDDAGEPSVRETPWCDPPIFETAPRRGATGVLLPGSDVGPVARIHRESKEVGDGDSDEDLVTGEAGDGEWVAPRKKGCPKPVLPRRLRRLPVRNVLLLQIEVFADGTVGRRAILKSCGHSAVDEFVRDWVTRWEFHPATSGGVRVRAVLEQQFRFR